MKLLWRSALLQIPSAAPIKKVLLLGLGAGSAIGEIYNRFPIAEITAIEWDPVMVEFARNLEMFPKDIPLKILIGDAVELLPTLKDKFDLILIDLFEGEIPEPRLGDAATITSTLNTLSPSGYVILNAFKHIGLIDALGKMVEHQKSWRFRYNMLAMFSGVY